MYISGGSNTSAIKEVSYENLRNKIKTGDFFFTANPAFFSRIIRAFSRFLFFREIADLDLEVVASHVGIFAWWGKRLLVIESVEGKGVINTMSSYRFSKQFYGTEEPIFWGRINDIPNDEELILDNATAELSKGYDMRGAILSAFASKDDNSFYCSELIAKTHGLRRDNVRVRRGLLPIELQIQSIEDKNFCRILPPKIEI